MLRFFFLITDAWYRNIRNRVNNGPLTGNKIGKQANYFWTMYLFSQISGKPAFAADLYVVYTWWFICGGGDSFYSEIRCTKLFSPPQSTLTLFVIFLLFWTSNIKIFIKQCQNSGLRGSKEGWDVFSNLMYTVIFF